jgi:hypothetical protein
VLDQQSVSALLIGDSGLVLGVAIDLIRYAVALSRNPSVCHSQHWNVISYIVQRAQTYVPAVMSLISGMATKWIQHSCGWIDIRHLLNKALSAKYATYRQPETAARISLGWFRQEFNTDENEANDHAEPVQVSKDIPSSQLNQHCPRLV